MSLKPPHALCLAAAFTAEECERLIPYAPPSYGAGVEAGLGVGAPGGAIRQATLAWLADEPALAWLSTRLTQLMAEAQRRGWAFELDGFLESAQVARYDVGGHYDWHIDRGSAAISQQRKLAVVVQLSPENAYSGGDLQLNPAGHRLSSPRTQGSAMVFPSYVLHRVTPVVSGTRFSLTQWIHGPHFV